ncbi:MAG: ZIP family metal transporter [Cyclobacteriaceae bacterium]
MITNIIVLFITAFLGGLAVFFIPRIKESYFKLALVFAGSYLFAITILHIIPELFIGSMPPGQVGLFLLIGFFFQFFLELFTSGVEHGHMHQLSGKNGPQSATSALLLIGLVVHSVMEGSLLAHPTTLHEHHHASGLLLGIVLHKVPAAFALMSILSQSANSKRVNILLLFIFSIASPVGVALGDYFTEFNLISPYWIVGIFAFVSGNFLKISTTILFESSPNHHFNLRRTLISLLGALVAVLIENVF